MSSSEVQDAGAPWEGALAAAFLAVAVALFADLTRKIVSGGPDVWGVVITVLPGLLAGGTFTKAGRVLAERLLARMGVAPKSQPLLLLTLSIAALVVALVLSVVVPVLLGTFYELRGWNSFRSNRAPDAVQDLQRAVSLQPDSFYAHYGLARAYEAIWEHDKALVEYQTAHTLAPEDPWPLINMGEVSMRRRGDFPRALGLLDDAVSLRGVDGSSWVQYARFRTRGWAHFELGYLALAEADLKTGIAARPGAAGAHCLLAQVKEAQRDAQAAQLEWEACRKFLAHPEGLGEDEVEYIDPRWRALAQMRVGQ